MLKDFVLGLSTTTLKSPQRDGIGHYTQQLLSHFSVMPGLRVYACTKPYWAPARQLDVYHATDYRIPVLSCPVVATLHDAISLKYPEWVRSRFRLLKNRILRHTAKRADGIISHSYAAIPDLVEYFGISEEKISVVSCGVSENWLRKIADEACEKILKKYSLQSPYFLFVGTLQPRKNIARLVDAFLPFKKDFQLVIVGKKGWYTDDLIPRLNKDNIRWLSAISSEKELRVLYQRAHVFVFPSLYEGFGLPVLEAFASRVPAIVSASTSLPEVAEDAAYFVDPLSVEAIREAMQKLSEEATLRTQLIEKGFRIAQKKTWTKCAEETFKVYEKVQ